ncbi:hypothetical protein ElyMa_005753700 [Elysia marginata]|uniref:Uncharacterized protein n=1 Tax=Elysia marginata TaxID=1093978 RepID=A0AAV4FM47_9GAST|nr:hypothetical protein ElyMa_005753700 [Elysia marginata]
MDVDHDYMDFQSEMQQQKDTHLIQQPQQQHPVDKEDGFVLVDKDEGDFVLVDKDGIDVDYYYVDVLNEIQQDDLPKQQRQKQQKNLNPKLQQQKLEDENHDQKIRVRQEQEERLFWELKALNWIALQPNRPAGTSDQLNEVHHQLSLCQQEIMSMPRSSLKESLLDNLQQTINWDSFV